ncbi:hypothetical protein, conserved [Leishmania donovani]|uniref:Uncharacterized protein n=1 Tax=Leishmania donovani TaxID=5661 RepID=E9BM77_LEIDO|nr:hypothetical protein, conserved [Leishmania donovani]AYU81134.1 hypothetical protein LdCL_300039000 [Leishmania donovani]CBZ36355.1 hypothetical protein, conserved [Leishmania donovani]
MPKKEKEKRVPTPSVTSPGITEEECLLEVYLHWDVEAQAAPDILVFLRLCQEDHFILPRQLPADANSDCTADGQQQSRHQQPSAAPPLLLLVKQTVFVGGSAVRHTLLNDSKANRIDVYALPSAGVGDEAGGKQAGGAAGKRFKSVTPAVAKSKGKSATGLAALPDGARHIGGATLSFVPLLASSTMDVSVPLTAGSLVDADKCLNFRVRCHDSLLLSAQCMSQCRPVLVRVYGVAGLPTLESTSGSSSTKDIAVAATADSRRRLRACVTLAGGCVTAPILPITPAISADEAVAPSSFPSHRPAATFHDHILFLQELGTPLDVYRKLHSAPCEVSLWQSFEMDAQGTAVAAASATSPPEKGTEVLLGSGGFSVRDFLTDDQTRFTETVQLLPGRSTVNLAKDSTCLTTGCSVSVRLDFFQPFTPLQHVDKEGQPLPRKAFLTRALVRLPYAVPWIADFLALLLREVTALPRATEDVQLYLPPPPPLPPTETAEKEKPAGGRSGTTHARGAAPPAASSSSKRSGSGSGNRKAGKAIGRPAPADPVPAPPLPSFAGELKVYSPPGLSGFEVADGEERLWCFEATVPELQRILSELGSFVEARGGATSQVHMHFNAELFVPQRAYVKFPPLVVPPVGMAAASPPPSEADDASVALEVEPSGTGGRLHRIRLRSAVGALCQTQSHYIRHNLSDDCLRCLLSLAALLRAASMREAEMRGWMPSATLLIAAERSFGQTLEKEDLFGVTFPTPAASQTTVAASVSMYDTTDRVSESNASGAAASLMAEAVVGSVVFFDGMLRAGTRRPVPAAVLLRFPVSFWMVVTKTKEEVLCTFPHNTPTGLVQYHIEGQVVRCSTVTLLYVLKCVCLARSVTQSHNAAYELVLRQRQREQHALQQERMAPSATSKLMAVWQASADAAGDGRDALRRGADKTRGSAVGQVRGTDSSDEDGAEEVDWLDSSMDRYLYTSSASPSRSSALSRRLRTDRTSSHKTSVHKTQRRQVLGAAPSPTELTYDDLWRMYEKRAPASATAAPARGHEKLPPIRF